MVGEISENENTHKRPMLSAVVVRQDNDNHGPGFFKLAEQFGNIRNDASQEQKDDFWRKE
jgi:hypothetical protein